MKKSLLLFTLAGGLALTMKPACADDAALPGEGFTASHYETLWTKSPFAVATAEAVQESADYSLVGITQLEGVSYASVIDKATQDHFLISSEKAIKGLKLTSITRSHAGSDTFATVEKDGQPITLKLDSTPLMAAPPMAPGQPPSIMVPPVTQNIQMPGANIAPPVSTFAPGIRSMRIHRPTIHLPPMPSQPDQPAPAAPPGGAQAPNQPIQSHNAPPPQ